MIEKEYCLKFNQLAKYAPDLIADPRASMSKFFTGVSSDVLKERRAAMLNRDMDLSRIMIHTQQIEAHKMKETRRVSKRAKTGSHGFSQSGSQGGSSSQYGWRFLVPTPSSANVLTPAFGGVIFEGAPSSKAQSSTSGVRTFPLCEEW